MDFAATICYEATHELAIVVDSTLVLSLKPTRRKHSTDRVYMR